jgi:hypothetical protein
MASLIFLIIHPIEYPIICGGKGKARNANWQRFLGKKKQAPESRV